ncbi:hypothetical protein ACJMK2_032068 [Sinanodonta woodiana]
MVPRPVVAVMLLYPLTDKSQESTIGEVQEGSDLYFIKQTIGNACGTIAIVHALANNKDKIQFMEEKSFSKFLSDSFSLTPEERAILLEKDEGMGAAHEDSAQEGQTQAPDRDEHVNTHFIAFICQNDQLYELDGGKDGPVHHGTSSNETLMEDAVEVVKKFMERDPDELNFTLMALVNSE